MPDALPWTFSMGGEIAEKLEWLTDAMASRNATEQARRLRNAPRTTFDFDVLEEGGNRRRMEAALHGQGAVGWSLPLVHDTVRLAVPLGSGSDQIACPTMGRRFTAGGTALLIGDDPAVYEVLTIASLDVDGITIDAPTLRAWPAWSRLMPLRAGYFPTLPNLQRFTADSAPLHCSVTLTESIDWPADFGSAVYRGQPVLELKPDWSADPEYAPARQIDVVDVMTGIPEIFDFPAMPLALQTMRYTLVGADEIAAFRSLLYALAGRWSTMWVPTRAHDFRLVVDAGSGDNEIFVEASSYSAWPLAINRRDLRIALRDGTVLYRRIVDADVLSDQVETLTLDSALGSDVDVENVEVISFMALCRQESDVNVLKWWSSNVVESELSFRGIRHGV